MSIRAPPRGDRASEESCGRHKLTPQSDSPGSESRAGGQQGGDRGQLQDPAVCGGTRKVPAAAAGWAGAMHAREASWAEPGLGKGSTACF